MVIHTDDIAITGRRGRRDALIAHLGREYVLKVLGKLTYYLGIHVEKHGDSYKITQSGYIKRILEKFEMTNCKPLVIPMMNQPFSSESISCDIKAYQSLLGGLIYIIICTCPDISHSVGVLSHFMSDPKENHYTALL